MLVCWDSATLPLWYFVAEAIGATIEVAEGIFCTNFLSSIGFRGPISGLFIHDVFLGGWYQNVAQGLGFQVYAFGMCI
jgi:hypothetical protein